jgi:hypothetical protein
MAGGRGGERRLTLQRLKPLRQKPEGTSGLCAITSDDNTDGGANKIHRNPRKGQDRSRPGLTSQSMDDRQDVSEHNGTDQTCDENGRRAGAFRMISPPRAFSAGYGFWILAHLR